MVQRDRYMSQLKKWVDAPVIKVLTGMRRAGKSSLLQLLKEYLLTIGIAESHILSLNLESMHENMPSDHQSLYQIIKTWIHGSKERHYLLLDEIQEVEGWEKAINAFLVDFDVDVTITGSNAHLLSSELATYLSGRYVEITVYPLTFRETLAFRKQLSNIVEPDLEKEFLRYLRYGGLPGIHRISDDPEVLNQYLKGVYSTVLLKDVLSRNAIRDTALMEKVVFFLMDNVGNLFSAASVSSFLKSQGRNVGIETIYNYLGMLEDAYLILKAPRYDIKGKRWLETNEKRFLSDLGIRHAVLGYRDMDIGGLLENVVHQELLSRGYKVSIGKSGDCEVDFVVTRGEEVDYYQVCYLLSSTETIHREFSVLRAISDNHPKIVLSMDRLLAPQNSDGIKWSNLVDFLLD